MMKMIGIYTETVSDGVEAINKYQESIDNNAPFSVIILDLTIPGGMGGKEAVQHILKINPDAKVIVSSGYSGDPVMANYQDYGFKGIVAKPYTISNLKKALNDVLGQS
ncbi:MAG: response regulator, partial [Candidatus Cloacimonadota bacterium]|nr:response regulator [Candidatus Cloacimonadota bacterium]